MRGIQWWLAIGLVIVATVPLYTHAQNPSFTLRPGKIEVELLPGGRVSREIAITNTLGRDALFDISFEDIQSTAGDNGVTLLGKNTGPASLKNYLFVDTQSISIPAGDTLVVPITIALPVNAPVGSLHGAVLVQPRPLDNVVGPQTVPRLGILAFVRVVGERVEAGQLTTFNGPLFLWHDREPKFTMTFENTGNTYLNPYGLITVRSLLGQVSNTQVKPWFVLPKVSRTHSSTHQSLSAGIYIATLELNRGYNDIVDSQTTWFVVLSWPFVAVFVLLLVCLVFGIWRGYLWYNKKQ